MEVFSVKASALNGIRVIDITRYISGPYCAQLLGDLGAEVIKIEKGSGDTSRAFLPYSNEQSLYFTALNRNKKSIKLDYRKPEGMQILTDLISKADVVVENFKPGVFEAMGFSKDRLEDINPDIVVVHISGYGQTGPYKDRAAFDCVLEAMSGMMSMTGDENSKPMLMGQAYVDFIAGTFGALQAIAALYARDKVGGQDIDVSMLECALAYSLYAPAHFINNGVVTGQFGNRDRVLSPANTFTTKDNRYIYIHAGTDHFFESLMKLIGREDQLTEGTFKFAEIRMENPDQVERIVQEWTVTKNAYDIENQLAELGIPCAVVANMSEVVHNPQLLERNMFQTMKYPSGTRIPVVTSNLNMSKTPGRVFHRAPMLGEHSEEILSKMLGKSAEDIDMLKSNEII